LDQCQKVHGQPCVRIKGIGLEPVPGLRMKCTGTPSTSARRGGFVAHCRLRPPE
jgi:hypothetical protein